MKAKKITAYIMSIAMLCSCGFCFNNKTFTDNITVSAMGISPVTFSCELNNNDFVIAEDETVNEWDLKRHGVKITRQQTNYHDMPEDELYGQQTTTTVDVSLDECQFEFPDKLQSGKNTVKITNLTGVTNNKPECTIEFNVRFSAEESEKKDLPGRSGVKYGDVDSNDIVDMRDLLRLSQYMLQDVNVTAGQYVSADTNGDEEVDIADVPTLRQYIMKDDIDLGHVQKSFQDIVLIKRHNNCAWAHQYTGSFYDKEGNEYSFDFSDKCDIMTDKMLINEIRKLYTSGECTATEKMNTENMTYISSLISKINPETGFDMNSEMCDYGQVDFLGVKHNDNFTDELVKAYSYGDVRYIPKDENAAELYRYYCEVSGFMQS